MKIEWCGIVQGDSVFGIDLFYVFDQFIILGFWWRGSFCWEVFYSFSFQLDFWERKESKGLQRFWEIDDVRGIGFRKEVLIGSTFFFFIIYKEIFQQYFEG